MLKNKLDIQKSKLKWYSDSNMLGAIKRTKNLEKTKILDTQKKIQSLNEYNTNNIFIDIFHIGIFRKAS